MIIPYFCPFGKFFSIFLTIDFLARLWYNKGNSPRKGRTAMNLPTDFLEPVRFLQLTETVQRYYYSAEPTLTRTEVASYPLVKGTEIFTSCGFLAISEVLTRDGAACGARIDYTDDDGKAQSVEILPGSPARIRFMEGSGDVYRVADCTFRILTAEEMPSM